MRPPGRQAQALSMLASANRWPALGGNNRRPMPVAFAVPARVEIDDMIALIDQPLHRAGPGVARLTATMRQDHRWRVFQTTDVSEQRDTVSVLKASRGYCHILALSCGRFEINAACEIDRPARRLNSCEGHARRRTAESESRHHRGSIHGSSAIIAWERKPIRLDLSASGY